LNRQINSNQQPEEFTRVHLPQKNADEILGTVESLLGANKLRVRCMDGVVRLTRIPVDIVWKYSGPQVNWLERKGFLKS
jgi:translation initiation factor 1A